MSEKINLDQEKLELWYEQFGSKKFQLQSEMAEDHGKKTLDLYHRSIDFIYKTITIIGIVAGFGFTAIDHVKNDLLFILGEGLLFAAIAVGIWSTQKIYLGERKNFDDFFSKIKKHFKEWYALFKPVFDKAIKNNLTRNDIIALQNKEWELVSILSDSPEIEKDRKDILSGIVWAIFGLFIFGGLMLLISFLIC
ncbi:hypothetical protein A2W39_01565 [Candidatus Azambacteria bacterium RIFCSPHIGHO2_01_46_10]|uniref:Uncharacterized protein n=4 Tax=Candidatus Azamiibacteriota TaxID=1752741 RepID=A0A1F5C5Z4_9BACT|nr:MAG: hypothetical protein A2W60_01350 [Candidatus Azambacteria bacterium RIFCSPHIGHO2_02_46_12]OGD35048.1 MAG: hypothetical protein A2W39_01565 [Candidatus Azambacteria bacterium RIFCSPHIGHO2_01_46_10]OGD38278.1 MAG: hypothetical protein A3A25_00890 [Candidatus Azambacteria bacterium RIFCSPLOWO2_01_FULL_46_26]OGD45408.1 MAG: hypothetical protein A3J02_00795 [Candidatus Azambacteria bacterium RIFCSPLOWO2_02_FULL_46_11]